jgi:hypothetical protein
MFIICLMVALYIFFAVLTYGFNFAYWQRKWPRIAAEFYNNDRWLSLGFAVVWPFSIMVGIIRTEGTLFNYGVKFK